MKIFRTIFIFFLVILFFILSPTTLAETSPKQVHFITLADIHFDPFLSCKYIIPCPLINKLQQSPVNQWTDILTQHDRSPIEYRKETNYPLLKSSLTAAQKEGVANHVQFGMVIGDFLAHNFASKYKKYTRDKTKEGYIAFVRKTMEFLTNQIHYAFPNIDIYFVVGNNDTYGTNYSSEPHGQFFKDMSNLWSTPIKDKNNQLEMKQAFPEGGYYAVTAAKQPQLRILVLNSVLFSKKAKGDGIDEAAKHQLDWLHHEMISAIKNKQHLLITFHIPMGIDVYSSMFNPFHLVEFWYLQYLQQFQHEIKLSSSNIIGIFTAHTHTDTFQVLTQGYPTPIPVSGTPSISPIYGNNPGFKIYGFSPPSLQLEDFTAYYYDINGKKEWIKKVVHLDRR